MLNKKRLPFAISIIIIFLTILLCHCTLTFESDNTLITLDDGWTVTLNNEKYENVKLSKFDKTITKVLSRGDHIVMTHLLPDSSHITNPTIAFLSRYTTLDCYIDDDNIYSFGHELFNNKHFLGKLYHIISMSPDYQGKKLTFVLDVAEDKAFMRLAPPLFGSHRQVAGTLVHENLIIISTGIFLFIFGVCFMCIALLFVSNVSEIKSLLLGSLLCMDMGIWLFCYYSILSFFIYTPYETQIEYFTLYMIIPFCYLLVYYIQDLSGNRVYLALMTVGCGIPVLQFLLHYFFNIHLRETLPLYHFDAIISFLVVLYYAIKNSRQKNIPPSSLMQMTGIVFFTVSEFMHLIIYILDLNDIPTIPLANRIIISLGCLIFAICQLSTYLIYVTDNYAQKKENISLSHLAYADGLTNLANRAKAEQYMASLDKTQDDYCIISIDLNGLKTVNDEYGHPTGDRYIKDFAKVLNNTFNEFGLCARVGGDEFMVILNNITDLDIDGLISRMNSALNVMNALYTEYSRSVAVGYSYRHEFETPNAHKVYMRADQRMYEEKRKMHEELGIHCRL